MKDRKEQGFTLIELLIAIVVVGILAAVAIVGIAGLTNTGTKSACIQSRDAAHAASAAYYANQTPNAYPADFKTMATDDGVGGTNHPSVYELPDGLTPATAFPTDPNVLENTWKLTMTPGATSADAPTFACT
jgi:prepilin-type N-terminal cleavage/methylation domain-containing protein